MKDESSAKLEFILRGRICPIESKQRWLKLEEFPFYGFLNVGNGTEFKIGIFNLGYKLFIGIERCGAFAFSKSNFKAWNYVSEKLNIPEADARNLADWLNIQIDHFEIEQGLYDAKYMD